MRKATRFVLGAFVVTAAACGGPGEGGPLEEMPDLEAILRSGELVDLTHSLSGGMPYWPSARGNPFSHDTVRAHPSGEPAMAAYTTPEHHGTHLDAPIHSKEGLISVDEIPLSDLLAPAVVIDVSEAASLDWDYAVQIQDILDWEAEHGSLPAGAIVLMRSGWYERWAVPGQYYTQDDEGGLHFPGFSPEAATFLVEERTIRGIGVDTGSVDPGSSSAFPVHGIVNGAGKYHLENVANLGALPERGAVLLSAPIKIKGGSGGQVRIIGFVP